MFILHKVQSEHNFSCRSGTRLSGFLPLSPRPVYRAPKGTGSKEISTGAWGYEEQVGSRIKRRERKRDKEVGKTAIYLEKVMGSQNADGKRFEGIIQMEGTENWWLSRQTAYFGAGSDMRGCQRGQPGNGTHGDDEREVML